MSPTKTATEVERLEALISDLREESDHLQARIERLEVALAETAKRVGWSDPSYGELGLALGAGADRCRLEVDAPVLTGIADEVWEERVSAQEGAMVVFDGENVAAIRAALGEAASVNLDDTIFGGRRDRHCAPSSAGGRIASRLGIRSGSTRAAGSASTT